MNNCHNIKRITIYASVLLIAVSALFYGIEQGLNALTINTVLDKKYYLLNEKILTLLFFAGCLIGISVFAILSRILGRRKTYFIVLYYLTGIILLNLFIQSQSYTIWFLKILMGIAAGSISFLVPLYISEISPPNRRGSCIAVYEFMITLGIFIVVIFTYFHILSFLITSYYILIPICLALFLSHKYLFKTESWLFIKEIKKAALKDTASTLKNFFDFNGYNYAIYRVIGLGIALQALQQLTGINAVIYYSVNIFNVAGISNPLFAMAAVISVKTIATLLVINIVDFLGRKNLLYFGFFLMGASLVFFGVLFYQHNVGGEYYEIRKMGLLLCSLLYIAAFAMSIGPIAWIICAEIFPVQYRELGMAVTTSTNWIFNALIIFICYYLFEKEHVSILMISFGIFCFIGILVTALFVPETSNIKLKDIERNLFTARNLRDIGDNS